MLPAGGTIPVERTRPPLNLTVLFNGFKPLLTALDPEQVNQLSFEIIQVLQGQGGTIQSLLASTASLTHTLADRDEVIGQVIDNLNAVLATINKHDEGRSELRDDIGLLGDLSENLNAQDEKLEQTIQNLPVKLEAVARAGSHGSWFNFYLCEFSGTIGLGPLPTYKITPFSSTHE